MNSFKLLFHLVFLVWACSFARGSSGEGPTVFGSRYWGTWQRQRTIALRPGITGSEFCRCWDSSSSALDVTEKALHDALCRTLGEEVLFTRPAPLCAVADSTDAAPNASSLAAPLFPAARGKFSWRPFGNVSVASHRSESRNELDAVPAPEWDSTLGLLDGDYVGSWKWRVLFSLGVGRVLDGVLSYGAVSFALGIPQKVESSASLPTDRFWAKFNATSRMNATARSPINATIRNETRPPRSKSTTESKALSTSDRHVLSECATISFIRGVRTYISSDGVEYTLSHEDAISRFEAGAVNEAPAVRFAAGILCNTTEFYNGNWTTFFVVVTGTSNHTMEQDQEASETLFMVCFAIGAVLATKAISDIRSAIHNSAAAQGKISFGTMVWLLLSGTLWFTLFCTTPVTWNANFRVFPLVFALLYVVTNVIQVSTVLQVRRTHLALGIPSLAGVTFWQGMFLATVMMVALVECGLLVLAPFLAVPLHSIFVPQLWHNFAEGHSPGISVRSASLLAGSEIVLIAPFFLRSHNAFLLEMKWSSTVPLVAVWLVVQVLLLRRQERYGPASIIPAMFRPRPHNYNIKVSELSAVEDPECPICRTSFLERDDDAAAPSAELEVWRTPCNHYYHRECLQRWLEERFECPMCRARLPKP